MSDDDKPQDIAPLRQPMVTSLGIIMGFLLNFLANWATEDENGAVLETPSDYAVAFTLMIAIALMCVVLYRLLDIKHTNHALVTRYHNTFRVYFVAIIIAFVGLSGALFL